LLKRLKTLNFQFLDFHCGGNVEKNFLRRLRSVVQKMQSPCQICKRRIPIYSDLVGGVAAVMVYVAKSGFSFFDIIFAIFNILPALVRTANQHSRHRFRNAVPFRRSVMREHRRSVAISGYITHIKRICAQKIIQSPLSCIQIASCFLSNNRRAKAQCRYLQQRNLNPKQSSL